VYNTCSLGLSLISLSVAVPILMIRSTIYSVPTEHFIYHTNQLHVLVSKPNHVLVNIRPHQDDYKNKKDIFTVA
jgi:hypothetical protein